MNEKKNKKLSVYRLGCILMFFFRRNPHLATRGDPGEREGMKVEKDIFSAFHSSSAFLLLNFLSSSSFAVENVFQSSYVSGLCTQLQGREMNKNLTKSAICLIVCDSIPLGPVPERPISANP